MPRGYRYVVVALVGCLIAAVVIGWLLQPEKPRLRGDRGYQAITSDPKAGDSSCEPSALDRLARRKRPAKADSCHSVEEQRREAADSLVEARRSADAADASIIVAYEQAGIAAWGTGLSFLTFCAAIGAAIFAERAAFHTKAEAQASVDALAEAKKINALQIRPYLSFDTTESPEYKFDPEIREPLKFILKTTAPPQPPLYG